MGITIFSPSIKLSLIIVQFDSFQFRLCFFAFCLLLNSVVCSLIKQVVPALCFFCSICQTGGVIQCCLPSFFRTVSIHRLAISIRNAFPRELTYPPLAPLPLLPPSLYSSDFFFFPCTSFPCILSVLTKCS